MVASGHSPQANAACADACVQRLNQIMEHGGLLVDELGLILSEYLGALGHAGRPGAGEKFVKWVHSNKSNPEVVRKVAITQRTDPGWRRFDQFPDESRLSSFDKSDQKFVAVALASHENPPILNAVDSDWWQNRHLLQDAGVNVEFLCPQHTPRK
ncbi:MAG: hypothetical protein K2W85_14280 [Phycisphaerales bacterium]|nr:hypothetical protein [Phycisphaerales bacterium]